MRSPRHSANARTVAPAIAKRSATPYSGAWAESWYVIACQVVPQTPTQIANSCQFLKRCTASVERVARASLHTRAQMQVKALDDDRVHAEGERTVEPPVGTVLREHVADSMAGNARDRFDIGNAAAAARLDQLESNRTVARFEDDLVEMILAVRIEATQHEVGPKACHRHGDLTGKRKSTIDLGERGTRHDEQRIAVLERGLGFDRSCPLTIREALRFRIEAGQAQRPAQEV